MVEKIYFSSRILSIIDYISKNYQDDISLKKTSMWVNLSIFYLCKVFKKEIGISFKKYCTIYRLLKGAKHLRSRNNMTITDLCYIIGFNDLSNFILQFKHYIGCTPKKFQNCSENPEKCNFRQKAVFYSFTGQTPIENILGIRLKEICYLNRARN